MISAFVYFLFLLYVLLVAVLIVGWHKAVGEKQIRTTAHKPLVSVVIAARNEEGNIGRLLQCICAQSYLHIEVIVVDDQSQDNTVDEVQQHIAIDQRITLMKSNSNGKKQALTQGIAVAKGSIIVTTDADCMLGENWVASLISYFESEKTKLVFGGVKISSQSFFADVQALEFASLIGSGGATAALGFPTMCNGANLAFRKDVFYEVGGYEGNMNIPSGDDEFLMRKINSKYPHAISFVGSHEAVVTTLPCDDVNQFVQQRLRWAGKWKHNQSATSVLLALFIFCFQASTIALPLLVLFHWLTPLVGIFLFMIKATIEFVFLQQVCQFLKIPWPWRAFILLQLFYPFYVVLIGVGANMGSFNWKGRRLTSQT